MRLRQTEVTECPSTPSKTRMISDEEPNGGHSPCHLLGRRHDDGLPIEQLFVSRLFLLAAGQKSQDRFASHFAGRHVPGRTAPCGLADAETYSPVLSDKRRRWPAKEAFRPTHGARRESPHNANPGLRPMSWHRGMHAADNGVGVGHGRTDGASPYSSAPTLGFRPPPPLDSRIRPNRRPPVARLVNNVEPVANWVVGGWWWC